MGTLVKVTRFMFWLGSLGAGVWVAFANRDHVVVRFPPWIEVPSSSGLIFIAFFLAGAACAAVFLGLDSIKKSLEIRRLKSEREDTPPARPTGLGMGGGVAQAPTVDPQRI